jgi:hypothetical protein
MAFLVKIVNHPFITSQITSIYTTHMYSLLQIIIQQIETIDSNINVYDSINKRAQLFMKFTKSHH